VGTWIQSVALGWLVYRLTNSAFLLGLVGFAGQIATFALSPFAGVLVDRWNKHRILIVTQSLFLLQAFALSALVLTGHIQVWQIIALGVFAGLVGGFDIPTRQSLVVHLVENREDMANAIALNSSMFNAARLVGPAAAGLLIAAVGEGWCFFINGVSYIAVIIALLAMRLPPDAVTERPTKNALHELREGFAYTFGFVPIRAIILLLAVISLVSMPYAVLMPIFATKILHGGPNTLGFLTASAGVGALIGATFLASRASVLGLGKWIAISAGILGAGLIGFGLSSTLWLSLLLLAVVGFAMITQMAASNTILQTIVSDDIRGRVMSFYTMAFMGMAPFGSLFAGVLASRIGAPHTVMICGVVAIVSGLWFTWRLPELRRLIRPIYCERGVVPPAVCGAENVSEITVPPEQC
jgi:MFS family permease